MRGVVECPALGKRSKQSLSALLFQKRVEARCH